MLMNDIDDVMLVYRARLNAAEKAIMNNRDIEKLEDIQSPADFFAICSVLSAQQKALAIEKFVTEIFDGKHVPSKANRGDFRVGDIFYESKMSTTNARRIMNIRQIRLYQQVDYYVCGYIDELNLEKSKCFILTKDEMSHEVDLHGSFTHGTKTENAIRSNSEYSISIAIGSAMMARWEENYFCERLYKALIAG